MKKKTKLHLRKSVIDAMPIVALYVVIILGVILVNARMGELNQQKMTDNSTTIISQK